MGRDRVQRQAIKELEALQNARERLVPGIILPAASLIWRGSTTSTLEKLIAFVELDLNLSFLRSADRNIKECDKSRIELLHISNV